MKFKPTYTCNIPDEVLIKDVIDVAKKLGKNTITRREHSEHGKYHQSTYRYRFRSWFTVLQLAGLQPSRAPVNIPEIQLFKNLENVWNNLGKQPTSRDMWRNPAAGSQYGSTTYVRRFGTWNNALRKFIEYQKSRPATEGGQIQRRIKLRKDAVDTKRKGWQPGIRFNSKMAVILRDGFRCTYCGRSPVTIPGVELHCDYVIPWRKGGKPVKDNLRTMCDWCYEGKYGKRERKVT